tara:strand:+ start:143 stop:1216 length:1074 start_codon:yes stop_codon:yes gene_type:complete
MAYTTVDKSTLKQNTKLYTGNDSAGHAITGVGFAPDWTWIKNRGNAAHHVVFDRVRGATKALYTNQQDAETTVSGHLTAFGSDGFTLGDNSGKGSTNGNGETYAAWNWKAAGTTGSSNSDATGSYPITSTVSVDQAAGFSIVKYTGNGYSTATIGHGLGAKPNWVILKPLSYSGAWWIIHQNLGTNKVLEFTSSAQADISSFGGGGLKYSTFTNAVIGGGNGSSNSDLWNKSGENYIAYCFAEKAGYSKFGIYTGNGDSFGPFAYTGFKPTWLMLKRKDSTSSWQIYDAVRNPNNPTQERLRADLNNAEDAGSVDIDLFANGFKLRNTGINQSNGAYIYMAFGQTLVGSNNIPATAR